MRGMRVDRSDRVRRESPGWHDLVPWRLVRTFNELAGDPKLALVAFWWYVAPWIAGALLVWRLWP